MKKAAPKKSNSKRVKLSSKTKSTDNKNKNFLIVGIGASAGGLEALNVFFDNTASDSGMAFVVIQHLDPTHKSLLSELIALHTKMNVSEVTADLKPKPNCVYIIPSDKDLELLNGQFVLSSPSQTRASRRPIDLFFSSLAKDQKDKAVGIILSGTGTDGTLGLKEIKAEGGISIVQEPQSAQYRGMPESAISSKIVDLILPPEKMTSKLLQYVKKLNHNLIKAVPETNVSNENEIKKIFLIIRNQTRYDFSNYKSNTIIRRITKRMALNQVNSIEDYISVLQSKPSEVENLYKDFLIGVTSFFRDSEVFDSLEQKTIPHLLQVCKEKQELRIWICGCSTGEEASSIAILLKEALEKNKQYIKVIIFASDIDKDAIEFARLGTYSESILPSISPERLARHFVKKENGYQLKKDIREMIVFAHHNVIKDPPFCKMDMISCRNLLIYMNSELQKKIISTFHYSLNSDGILLLGTSESIGEFADQFENFDQKSKIFKKKRDTLVRKPSTDFELSYLYHPPVLSNSIERLASKKKLNISSITEKILLDNYAPPSVIIDKNNDALYFSGNTGLYLEPPSGEARLNIIEMAKKSLKRPLENAIKDVRAGKKEVQYSGVEVKVNDYFNCINIVVKQVLTKDTDMGALMIIFESADRSKTSTSIKTITLQERRKLKPSNLEKELKITRENLQIAINQLESSHEDLQTTNEEFQSSNEALQSSNEELETSKEELQSVNEEMITVNSELQNKITQLTQANDDLNNLLRSIEVATVFLDRNLKIKRFTPTATKIFNLIPSDIDRPVTHLSSNLVYKGLADDVKDALKTLAVKSADVHTSDGTWYHMRIIPYRTSENIIEGVLVTFVENTEQKNVEQTLKNTNEHLNLIIENLPAIPYTCDSEPELKISFVGKSCEKVTGFLPEQFTSKISFWLNRIHPNDKRKMLAALKNISKKGCIEQPFRWKCLDGKYKKFTNYIQFAAAENGRSSYIVGVWQEIKGTVEKNKK